MKKFFLFILILAVLLAAITGAGYYFYRPQTLYIIDKTCEYGKAGCRQAGKYCKIGYEYTKEKCVAGWVFMKEKCGGKSCCNVDCKESAAAAKAPSQEQGADSAQKLAESEQAQDVITTDEETLVESEQEPQEDQAEDTAEEPAAEEPAEEPASDEPAQEIPAVEEPAPAEEIELASELKELTKALEDERAEKRYEAWQAWQSALDDLEEDSEKANLIEYALKTLEDKELLDDVAIELLVIDEKPAIELISQIIAADSELTSLAKDVYQMITFEEWSGPEGVEEYLREKYIPPTL